MLLRLAFVFSSIITPYFLKFIPVHLLSSYAEALNFIIIVITIIAIKYESSLLFIIMVSLKGFPVGIINVCRFSWLKAMSNTEISGKILISIKSISQSTYAIAGVLYIFFAKFKFLLLILYIDAFSSILGFILFITFSGTTNKIDYKQTKIRDFFQLFKRPFSFLTMIDFIYFLAIGGSNILLIKYGNLYLSDWGGYGTALISYGLFYFLGGLLINKHKDLSLAHI